MLLTWDKGYDDYEDPAWEARLKRLRAAWQRFDGHSSAEVSRDEMLTRLEEADEMMRYYAYQKDYPALEALMRAYEPLLARAEKAAPEDAGWWYLLMDYQYLNALLYMAEGAYRQAGEHLRSAQKAGEACIRQADAHQDLYHRGQMAYLLWAYAECLDKMGTVSERLLDGDQLSRAARECLLTLDRLTDFLDHEDGIRERAAALYMRYAATCRVQGDMARAMEAYQSAVKLYDALAENDETDYYAAMSLWTKSQRAVQIFAATGSEQALDACLEKTERFLKSGHPGDAALSVASGARATLLLQKSSAAQARRDMKQALLICTEAGEHFEKALDVMEEIIIGDEAHLSAALTPIAAALYTGSLTADEGAAVLLYATHQFDRAREGFRRALSRLSEKGPYTLPEEINVYLQADCCRYLALLAADSNDRDQMTYYASQALEQGGTAGKKTRNPFYLDIAVTSAALLADLASFDRDREGMKKYATQGLAFCDLLEEISPENPALQLRGGMMKTAKKAEKRLWLF